MTKRSPVSSQSWVSPYGQRKVITAGWHDMEKSCPTQNTKRLPGHRTFDVPSVREEMARLKVIIVINFNSVTRFQESSGKSFMSPVLSSPYMLCTGSKPGI